MLESIPPELVVAAFVVVSLGVLLRAIAAFIRSVNERREIESSREGAGKGAAKPLPIDEVSTRLEATEGHLEEAIANFSSAVARFEQMRDGLATATALETLRSEVNALEAKVDDAVLQIAELRGELRARTMGETIQPR